MDKQMYLFIIMILCGIIGGVTVHVTTLTKNDKENFFNINLLEKVLYGIIASFLVPLFLNTISSSLIDEIGTKNKSIFIFIGFCLIASLSSKLFIATLTEKMIKTLQKQQNDINDLKDTVEPIVVKNTDTSTDVNFDSFKIDQIKEDYNFLNLSDGKLLLEFGKNDNAFLTISSLSEETGISRATVSRILNNMLNKGIIKKSHFNQTVTYGLSVNGMEKYKNLINTTKWKINQIKPTNIHDMKDISSTVYNIILESDYGEHILKVYSKKGNLNFIEGNIIVVQSVDGKKVDSNYVKVISSKVND